MNLHGVIAKVEELGCELEHEIAKEAKAAWEFLKAELEKLRPHAHPSTGVITFCADGSVAAPEPATPTAAESNAGFEALQAKPQQTETVGEPVGIPTAAPAAAPAE